MPYSPHFPLMQAHHPPPWSLPADRPPRPDNRPHHLRPHKESNRAVCRKTVNWRISRRKCKESNGNWLSRKPNGTRKNREGLPSKHHHRLHNSSFCGIVQVSLLACYPRCLSARSSIGDGDLICDGLEQRNLFAGKHVRNERIITNKAHCLLPHHGAPCVRAQGLSGDRNPESARGPA